MKLSVINEADGRAVSEVEVADAVFGTRFNEPLVHQVVVAFQSRARQGAVSSLPSPRSIPGRNLASSSIPGGQT